LKVKPFHKS